MMIFCDAGDKGSSYCFHLISAFAEVLWPKVFLMIGRKTKGKRYKQKRYLVSFLKILSCRLIMNKSFCSSVESRAFVKIYFLVRRKVQNAYSLITQLPFVRIDQNPNFEATSGSQNRWLKFYCKVQSHDISDILMFIPSICETWITFVEIILKIASMLLRRKKVCSKPTESFINYLRCKLCKNLKNRSSISRERREVLHWKFDVFVLIFDSKNKSINYALIHGTHLIIIAPKDVEKENGIIF